MQMTGGGPRPRHWDTCTWNPSMKPVSDTLRGCSPAGRIDALSRKSNHGMILWTTSDEVRQCVTKTKN